MSTKYSAMYSSDFVPNIIFKTLNLKWSSKRKWCDIIQILRKRSEEVLRPLKKKFYNTFRNS